jgi:hypothetical protein
MPIACLLQVLHRYELKQRLQKAVENRADPEPRPAEVLEVELIAEGFAPWEPLSN